MAAPESRVVTQIAALTDETERRPGSWEDVVRRLRATPKTGESREEYVERKKHEEVAERIDAASKTTLGPYLLRAVDRAL